LSLVRISEPSGSTFSESGSLTGNGWFTWPVVRFVPVSPKRRIAVVFSVPTGELPLSRSSMTGSPATGLV